MTESSQASAALKPKKTDPLLRKSITSLIIVMIFSWLFSLMALRVAKTLENQACHYSLAPLSKQDEKVCELILIWSDISILWWLLTPIAGGLIWVLIRGTLIRSRRVRLTVLRIMPLLPLMGIVGVFAASRPYWPLLEWQMLINAITDW